MTSNFCSNVYFSYSQREYFEENCDFSNIHVTEIYKMYLKEQPSLIDHITVVLILSS